MGKHEITVSMPLFLFALFLMLFSSVSCTPLLIGQAACEGSFILAATTQQTKHPDKNLKGTVTAFNNAIIFEDYDEAASHVSRQAKVAFWSQMDTFKKNIRLSQFNLSHMDLDKDRENATVILHIEYWKTESPTTKNASITQQWQYNKKDKKWEVNNSGLGELISNH
ncbi:MAG: hypothetical protein ACP5IL_11685 [Syntrophobacteraceae bacterium]